MTWAGAADIKVVPQLFAMQIMTHYLYSDSNANAGELAGVRCNVADSLSPCSLQALRIVPIAANSLS